MNYFECLIWLSLLLIQCGDVETNPGPEPKTFPAVSLSNAHQHLSIVHYNVQSFYNKKDILYAELLDFDIVSFTETWLGDNIKSDDILFDNFSRPFRRDRNTDNHGGGYLFTLKMIYMLFDV